MTDILNPDLTDIYRTAVTQTRTVIETRTVLTATKENFVSLVGRFGANIYNDRNAEYGLAASLPGGGGTVKVGDTFLVENGTFGERFVVIDPVAANLEGWKAR